jgi:hypothetical protein
MEILLSKSDKLFFDSFYNATIPASVIDNYFTPNSNLRIFVTIYILEMVGVNLLYFLGSGKFSF